MKNLFAAGVLTAGMFASAAHAVEVTGGYVDLGYKSFTDSDDGSVFNLNGSGEVGFTRSFSLQLDLGVYNFRDGLVDALNIDSTSTNIALHTNFHPSSNLSLGGFFARDDLGDGDFNTYGIEAGFDAGQVDIEGYLGRQELDDVSGSDGTVFGIAVSGFVTDEVELSANYDLIDNFLGGFDVSVVSVGVNYHLADNAEIYGEFGSARAELLGASNSETFVGIGVRMNLGNARGTTFGRRGVLDKLPGF